MASAIASARSKKVRFDKGAVVNGGYEVNTVGIGNSSTTTYASYKTSNSLRYFNSLASETYTGSAATSYGLPVTTQNSQASSDYNLDNIILRILTIVTIMHEINKEIIKTKVQKLNLN